MPAPRSAKLTHSLGAALAFGAVTLGVAAAVVQAGEPDTDVAGEAPWPTFVWWLAAGVAVVLLAAVVSPWLPSRRPDRAAGESAERTAALATLAALAALVLAGYTVPAALNELSHPLPLLHPPLLGLAAVLATVATLVLAFTRSRPLLRPTAAAGASGLAVATAVALLAGPVLDSADAATAQVAAVEATPATPTKAAWQRKVDDFTAVAVGGTGFLVAADDGVTALDGRTGKARWHYRRPGARAAAVATTPDGSTALALFSVSRDDGDRSLLVSLDTSTGEKQFARFYPDAYLGFGELTNRVLAGGPPGRDIEAYDVRSGELVWQWEPPQGCEAGDRRAMTGTVVVSMMCGMHDEGDQPRQRIATTVVGLDDRTGRQRWRYERAVTTSDDAADVALAASIIPRSSTSVVQLEPHNSDRGLLLAAGTGKLLYTARPGEPVALVDDQVAVVGRRDKEGRTLAETAVDLRTGKRTRLPKALGDGSAYTGTTWVDPRAEWPGEPPELEPQALRGPGAVLLYSSDGRLVGLR